MVAFGVLHLLNNVLIWLDGNDKLMFVHQVEQTL